MNHKLYSSLASAMTVSLVLGHAAWAGPFDRLKEKLSEELADETRELRDDTEGLRDDAFDLQPSGGGKKVARTLGSLGCALAAKESGGSGIDLGEMAVCTALVQVLANHLTDRELEAVEESTNETLETGESRTWSNETGTTVETHVVRDETRVEAVALTSRIDRPYLANQLSVMYTGPAKDTGLLGVIEPQSEVFVVGAVDDWLAVRQPDDAVGFVEPGYLVAKDEAAAAADTSQEDPVVVAAQTEPPATEPTASNGASTEPEEEVADSTAGAPVVHGEADAVTVEAAMRCRTVERSATLADGETVVEEVTACLTPEGWRRV